MDFFAYIDPGTGSLFAQAIIGSALAGLIVFRGFASRAFSKVKSIVSRQKTTDEEV